MGCKVNTYDTSLLEKKLIQSGFTLSSENEARVQIINSCAVTEKSSLETHRQVKKLKARFPNSTVVITGCVAQVDIERLTNLTGADLIIGNSHKTDFEKTVRSHLENLDQGIKNTQRVFHSNIFKKDELDPGGGIESSRTRAFLKIQDGCNSFCSFCIIPFARGKSRSLSKSHLVERVRNLVTDGFKEVVLTGVHCGDYEDDQGQKFADLVEAVLFETSIQRVRLSSLEPIEVTPKLWSLFETQERLCPHIHASIQSANSSVLKDMRRKYGQSEIKDFFKHFTEKVPGGFIGMDIIAGFPGESDSDFEDTYQFLEREPSWTRMHVFPYSIRPGTTASKSLNQVSSNVIHSRARRLRELSLGRQALKATQQIGQVKKVLILEKPTHGAQSLSRDYWPVRIDSGFDFEGLINQEIEVQITGILPLKNSEQILTAMCR
jgi:threonylcarbamoyladenosine tRNA methylthiotransferase MtaB